MDISAQLDCSAGTSCVLTTQGWTADSQSANGLTLPYGGGDLDATTTSGDSGIPNTAGNCDGEPASQSDWHVTATTTALAFDVKSVYQALDCPDGTTQPGGTLMYHFDGTGAALPPQSGSDPGAGQGDGSDPGAGQGEGSAPGAELVPGSVAAQLATPSVLSSLRTPAEALSPVQVSVGAGVTVLLVIIIALPTTFFDSAVETLEERRAERRERLGKVAPAWWTRFTGIGRGFLHAVLTILVASIIAGFSDPEFLLTAAAPRELGSIFIGLAITVVLGWFISIGIARLVAKDQAKPEFSAAPWTLLVVIGTVLFTRFTGFEPGIIFGLVAGVGFGALASQLELRISLVTVGWGFVLATGAWFGYAALSASGVSDGNAGLVFVQETLAGITIGGFSAAPIALLPIRGLGGKDLWDWNRWVWAAAYAVGMLGFVLVVLGMPDAWDSVDASLWVWIGLFAAYVVVAVGTWLVVTRPWAKESEESEGGAAADEAEGAEAAAVEVAPPVGD